MASLFDPGDLSGSHHADFRLSITKALGDQLADALETLGRVPLTEENIGTLRGKPGVYQLFTRGETGDEFVYVGKAEPSLPARLRQHLRKLSGRENVSLDDVLFSCLYVDEDFSALAPERLLISHYRRDGKIPWNTNGFGNRDPGRRRDDTAVKQNHFDALFPADLDRVVEGLIVGSIPLRRLCHQVKKGLAFTFRYDKQLGSAGDSMVTVTKPDLTADQAFALIARHLPKAWQVVALPGYVLMYPDSPHPYPSARRYYRGVTVTKATPQFDAPGEVEEDSVSGEEEDQPT